MGPCKLISNAFFISDAGVSSMGPVIPTPALFITMSNRPSSSMILVITSLIELGLVTSIFNRGKDIFS